MVSWRTWLGSGLVALLLAGLPALNCAAGIDPNNPEEFLTNTLGIDEDKVRDLLGESEDEDSEDCRSFHSAVNYSTGLADTILCSFDTSAAIFYCRNSSVVFEHHYETIKDFIDEAATSFRTPRAEFTRILDSTGNAHHYLNSYDAEGRLVSRVSPEDNTSVVFSEWSDDGLPVTGKLNLNDQTTPLVCLGVDVTYSYSSEEKQRTIELSGGSGAQCGSVVPVTFTTTYGDKGRFAASLTDPTPYSAGATYDILEFVSDPVLMNYNDSDGIQIDETQAEKVCR